MRTTARAAWGASAIAVIGITAIGLGEPSNPNQFRSVDGTGNNQSHSDWGSVGVNLLRLAGTWYDDGISVPGGAGRPSPREVSNAVCAQSGSVPNPGGATDFTWQWGQFIDHDITLVDLAIPLEPFNIPVPLGDAFFDPDWEGDKWILLERSQHDPNTGTDESNPRQQFQSITAFIDASQVYGSDMARANELRMLDGSGKLKMSESNLLPFNVNGFPNLGGPDPSLFLAGDIRANEQLGLTSMHTLFAREHNRLATMLAEQHHNWDGERIYQEARAIVGGEIQAITYHEFLPILIGPDALGSYSGYDPDENPGIANEFATAAYRVGHTLLSPELQRIDANGEEIEWGHVALRDAFLNPDLIINEGGIAPVLRGLASQPAQNIDTLIIDEVRNFLFGPPGAGGFDLASLNMQRGREHGLPSYNQMRAGLDLEPRTEFSQITSDSDIATALEEVYGDIDDVDLWVAALAEDHVDGAMIGEVLHTIITDQFRRLRDGDRFWYQRVFHGQTREYLESVRLSDIIRWNTEIDDEIADDVFHLQGAAVCVGDLDEDGRVGLFDLLALFGAWGDGGGPADLDGDGTVGIFDLLVLISSWGPCVA